MLITFLFYLLTISYLNGLRKLDVNKYFYGYYLGWR